ncbi:MAG: glycosyltransferase family 4 protein [Chloroflexi bacterium]|nr:glycosyltransferase family 4 protein [Chloroflexota bacterium]
MNIGFISTRLAGTDGVSLETAKMVDVMRQMSHNAYFCAGELDNHLEGLANSMLHFEDKVAQELHHRAFVAQETAVTLLPDIQQRAQELKRPLRHFLKKYAIDYVVIQNVFAIPMQLPLARALTQILAETSLPALAHNHDFYWERPRYLHHNLSQYLDQYFPPILPKLSHAVINSLAQTALRQRRGLDSFIIPNVFNFATPPPSIDNYNADFRQAIGLTKEDWLILQPTRVVPRKGIELAIELLHQLNDPRAKLIITHKAGDEGLDYLQQMETLARTKGVDLRYVADQVDEQRGKRDGRKIYSLWDTYPHADLITYPSFIEGFGNALIETIYFNKPAVVNKYPVYTTDIAPRGFQFAEIDKEITPETVKTVRQWLEQPQTAVSLTTHNYSLGKQHFSYATLRKIIQLVWNNMADVK